MLWLQKNRIYKSRDEKLQSRIKALETLAKGTSDENEVARTLSTLIIHVC